MNIKHLEVQEALAMINEYTGHGTNVIQSYYHERGMQPVPLLWSKEMAQVISRTLGPDVREAIDFFINRMEIINSALMDSQPLERNAPGMVLRARAVESMGLYVPAKLVSSLITWASAASSAGVQRIAVYLPIDPATNAPSPACVYAAQRYNAELLCGPARFAFPVMAFGSNPEVAPVDMLCGPAGKRLNILKQICCLLTGARPDFFAGPSDLAVVVMDGARIEQALEDIGAQLEHGDDSRGSLVLVGEDVAAEWNRYVAIKPLVEPRISCYMVHDIYEAASIIKKIAPESLELLGGDIGDSEAEIFDNFGVFYTNYSSSLGDYMAVGRGCADPTQGSAKSWGGISPLTFLRHQAIVRGEENISRSLPYASILANYEQKYLHKAAFESYATECIGT